MRSRVYVLGLAVLLPSCGGGGSGPTTATPPTTMAACMQTVLFQGSGAVAAGQGALQNFSVSSTVATRLDIVVDWTATTSLIGVYVIQGACSAEQANAGACNIILRSDPSSIKPRRLSVPNVAPGSYAVLVANLGSVDESVAGQIVLSSTTCPPLAGAVAARRQ